MAIFGLNSRVRHYPWGSHTALAEMMGRAPSGEPEAELWMGAHPGCPSPLVASKPGVQNLLELLQQEPRLAGNAEGRLPYLFKILSADSPLSLQAHPGPEQARAGFERENAWGLAPDDPSRNYKDPRHKPELLMAVTDFAALCGFMTPAAIAERFDHYGLPADLLAVPTSELGVEAQLRQLFQRIFELPPVERLPLIECVRAGAEADIAAGNRLAPFGSQLVRLVESYPGDPGILAALLLHFVQLRPGEALYLPAGVLHSYLGGTGLEVMASSDNVLRGGLTSKHVDLPELLTTLIFDAYSLQLAPVETHTDRAGATVTTFLTPAPEFELSLLTLSGGVGFRGQGPDILLGLGGGVVAVSGGQQLSVAKGQQVFCSAGAEYELRGFGHVARATVNHSSVPR